MEQPISKSEKKRRAKNLETLAAELVNLPLTQIQKLPCDEFLKKEISSAAKLKSGARKRQIKYITKNLRQLDPEPMMDFLAEKKGSRLKETTLFRTLERLRDDIIAEAFDEQREARKNEAELTFKWHSKMIEIAEHNYPGIDGQVLKDMAIKFAITGKPNFKREIFRLLKTAQEKIAFDAKSNNDSDHDHESKR